MSDPKVDSEVEATTTTPSPTSVQPRENLLDPAVKFLQNHKVQLRPVEQRIEFLRQKGLTDTEIDIAFERAGPAVVQPISSVHSASLVPSSLPPQPKSYLQLFKDYSTITVIFGSVVYAVYWCYKKFIEPYFTARQDKQDAKLRAIEEAIGSLHRKVAADTEEALANQQQLENDLKKLSSCVEGITVSLQSRQDIEGNGIKSAVKPLHDDMTSLKSLILSSKQFPANPVNRPLMIPSWQMKTTTTTTKASDDNKSNQVEKPPQMDESKQEEVDEDLTPN